MTTRESPARPRPGLQDVEPGLPCLPACVPFIERMVDGTRPENDAALSDHVRGCLPCYRAAIELASVSEVAAALTQASPQDPGDLFFASFTRRVADAWLTEPGRSAIDATTTRHQRARSGRVLALVGLGTALAAAAAVLLIAGSRRTDGDAISARGGSGSRSATVGSARLPGSSPAIGNDDRTNDTPDSDIKTESESESDTEIPLDPMAEIETLDTGTLVRLVDAVSRELVDDLAEADNPTAGLTATESLELLGTPALAILSEDLHGIRDP